jgi:hypothetical protein
MASRSSGGGKQQECSLHRLEANWSPADLSVVTCELACRHHPLMWMIVGAVFNAAVAHATLDQQREATKTAGYEVRGTRSSLNIAPITI